MDDSSHQPPQPTSESSSASTAMSTSTSPSHPTSAPTKDAHENTRSLLNIVFFVPHGSIWSLKLKCWQWRTMGAIIGAIILWAVISVIYVSLLSNELSFTREHLRKSQRAIFEYQSRYSGVYELAYPEHHTMMPSETPQGLSHAPSSSTPSSSSSPTTSEELTAGRDVLSASSSLEKTLTSSVTLDDSATNVQSSAVSRDDEESSAYGEIDSQKASSLSSENDTP